LQVDEQIIKILAK